MHVLVNTEREIDDIMISTGILWITPDPASKSHIIRIAQEHNTIDPYPLLRVARALYLRLRTRSAPASKSTAVADAATKNISITNIVSSVQKYIKFHLKKNVDPGQSLKTTGIHINFFFFL